MSRYVAIVSLRGAKRWQQGHPWIFRSDVSQPPLDAAGAVRVRDVRGQPLGWALWSPGSEISLRRIDRDPDAVIDGAWWHAQLERALRRRAPLTHETNAYRLVHGEGDGLPSLVVDRFDRWLVVQLLSAGLEAYRPQIVEALRMLSGAEGAIARNDAAVRDRERLPRMVELLWGTVPDEIEVREHGVRYLAAPRTGQKTGAFLDQREARVLVGSAAHGRALDLFSYHGSFALHLARRAEAVTAVDSSGPALARAAQNAVRTAAQIGRQQIAGQAAVDKDRLVRRAVNAVALGAVDVRALLQQLLDRVGVLRLCGVGDVGRTRSTDR